MESLGWILMQYDWYPYIKRDILDRDRHTYSEDDEESQGEDNQPQAKETGTTEILPHGPQKTPNLWTP